MADDDDRINKNEERVNDKAVEEDTADESELVVGNEEEEHEKESKEEERVGEEVDDKIERQKDDSEEKNSLSDDKEQAREEVDRQHDWQAVWDATRQAWYFWNQVTQETTWENPLMKEEEKKEEFETPKAEKANEDTTISMNSMTDEQVAQMVGIDPDLAYLDPIMYANEIHQARMGNTNPALATSTSSYRLQGAFDSRTGKFVSTSNLKQGGTYDPSRLSHANQADRQMGAFFDVEQYEDQRKREHENSQLETDEQGRIKRQRPSKKELKFFKERAKEKKASKHAWLRN